MCGWCFGDRDGAVRGDMEEVVVGLEVEGVIFELVGDGEGEGEEGRYDT